MQTNIHKDKILINNISNTVYNYFKDTYPEFSQITVCKLTVSDFIISFLENNICKMLPILHDTSKLKDEIYTNVTSKLINTFDKRAIQALKVKKDMRGWDGLEMQKPKILRTRDDICVFDIGSRLTQKNFS